MHLRKNLIDIAVHTNTPFFCFYSYELQKYFTGLQRNDVFQILFLLINYEVVVHMYYSTKIT